MAGIARTLTSGTRVPFLAFGTGSALYQQECTHYVSQAIKSGFTHIDTAQAYGNEQSVGKALAAHFSENPRESLFVTTKFDRLLPNESVRSVLEDQLRKLQVSYVDLYLVHWPVPFEGRLGPIWKEVEQLKRDGLAKEIGISNYRVEDLDELLPTITERPDGILPSVHQIELHPHVLDTTLPILEIGKKYGIQVASYGGLTPIIRMADGPVRAIAESIVKKWREARKDATVGHVMLKWLDAKGAIAVTTSTKRSRLAEMQSTSSVPDLTAEEVNALDEAGLKIHYRQFVHHMDVKRD